jgi:hypothetical protein
MKTTLTVLATLTVALTTLSPAFAAQWKPDQRHPRPTADVSTYHCGNELGYLKRVYEEELDEVTDVEDVSIVPVCENEDYGLMRSDGNAGAIRTHIADNDAMTEALDFANYRADDVVGVRMTGDDTVILYVHNFHHM